MRKALFCTLFAMLKGGKDFYAPALAALHRQISMTSSQIFKNF